MSLVYRPATQENPMLYAIQSKPPAESHQAEIATNTLPSGGRVGGARRVLMAAVLGGVVLVILNWALIAWALQ